MRHLLLVIGLFAVSTASFAQHPGDTVNAVFADKYGAVWFGTDYGLLRKTDNTWKAYFTKDNEPVFVNSLTNQHPADSILWVGTKKGAVQANISSGGLVSTLAYDKNNSAIESDVILDIALNQYLNCFYATPLGLGILVDKIWSFIKTIGDVPEAEYTSAKALGDTIYIGTRGKGVARLIKTVDGFTGASAYVQPWAGLPSDDIICVFIDSKRNQWYGTSSGVARHTSIKTKQGWDVYITNELPDLHVNAIAEDPDGNIWIGTSGGLSKLASDLVTITNYKISEGLPDNHINTICVLSKNSIWIGTNKGASHFDGTKFENVLTSDFAKNFEGPAGIRDNAAAISNFYMVYPNPVTSGLNITFTKALSQPAVAEIFNLQGSLLKSWTIDKNQSHFYYDLCADPGKKLFPGTYLLLIQTVTVKQASKILVQ